MTVYGAGVGILTLYVVLDVKYEPIIRKKSPEKWPIST